LERPNLRRRCLMENPAPALDFSSFAEAYERLLVGPLFRPWAELIVERLRLGPGDHVLDVACGTGIAARLAKARVGPGGRVVGVDVNPQMLAVARTLGPEIDWREGNAGALPVGAGEPFDVVVCQQGLQFFPDKPLAAREMRRVLVSGGRLAIATWRPLEEMSFLEALHRVAERHVGPVADARHGFGDDRALSALLVDAGFEDVRVEVASLPIRFADGAVFVRLNAMALVGMSARSKEMGEEERARTVAAIVQESEEVLRPHADGGGLTYELRSNVATARG
jgi:ubiquinone/menaquinone biosynthesis C-methylase UbiE